MTGAEAAGEVSVVASTVLVVFGGCVFGITMGVPVLWVVGMAIAFAFTTGFYGTVIAALIGLIIFQYSSEWVVNGLMRFADAIQRHDRGHSGAERAERRSGSGDRRKAHRAEGAFAGAEASPGFGGGTASSRKARSRKSDGFSGGARARKSGKKSGSAHKESTFVPGPRPEEVLGLKSGYSMKDLDKARRKMAKKCHPDLHRRASQSKQKKMAEQMRAINSAYEVLKKRMPMAA